MIFFFGGWKRKQHILVMMWCYGGPVGTCRSLPAACCEFTAGQNILLHNTAEFVCDFQLTSTLHTEQSKYSHLSIYLSIIRVSESQRCMRDRTVSYLVTAEGRAVSFPDVLYKSLFAWRVWYRKEFMNKKSQIKCLNMTESFIHLVTAVLFHSHWKTCFCLWWIKKYT